MLTGQQKQTLLTFMANHPTAVIATASTDGVPTAAVVLFANDDKLNIIFATYPTRKYHNLKANPHTALALTKDWSQIQAHGQSQELTGADAEDQKRMFVAKHPEMDKHLMEGSVFFRMTPQWVRYTDTGLRPPVVWEVKLS